MKRLFRVALFICLLVSRAPLLLGQTVGQRIQAAAGGANVRDSTLSRVLFTQDGGVHGTITAGPISGTAGGFTGNWWRIRWDSQPPSQGSTEGWSAQSVISSVPSAGDVPQPSFSTNYYKTDNIFWQSGNAPSSTNPPNPQLGSALGNCTWYAHGRLRELGYSATQLNAMTGNASQWDNQALAAGIPVDSLPTVGSIAQTDLSAGGFGHVAVVESLNADGTITITESSFTEDSNSTWNFLWRHRTTSPAWFQRFIHVSRLITVCPGCGAPTQDIANKIAAAYNLEGRGVLGDPTTNVGSFTNTYYGETVTGYYQDFSGTFTRAVINYIPGDAAAYSVKYGFSQIFYSSDPDASVPVYSLVVAPTSNEQHSSSRSAVGTDYNWQPFRKGSMYYFVSSPLAAGKAAGHVSYTWGYISERYQQLGGRSSQNLGLPLFRPFRAAAVGSWEVWYQWFERGLIWEYKLGSTVYTYVLTKTTDVFSDGTWTGLGWVRH